MSVIDRIIEAFESDLRDRQGMWENIDSSVEEEIRAEWREMLTLILEESVVAEELLSLRERLAALEHEQWMKWAGTVMPEVSQGRQARWQQYMVPYEELTEEVKDYDRKWADKILAILEEG